MNRRKHPKYPLLLKASPNLTSVKKPAAGYFEKHTNKKSQILTTTESGFGGG